MATGPEHYAKAQQHLAAAAAIETDGHDDRMSAWHQRQAQVHMTAALVAAAVESFATAGDSWWKVLGPENAAEHTWHGNCAIDAPCRGSL